GSHCWVIERPEYLRFRAGGKLPRDADSNEQNDQPDQTTDWVRAEIEEGRGQSDHGKLQQSRSYAHSPRGWALPASRNLRRRFRTVGCVVLLYLSCVRLSFLDVDRDRYRHCRKGHRRVG